MSKLTRELQIYFSIPFQEAEKLFNDYYGRAKSLTAKEFNLDIFSAMILLINSDRDAAAYEGDVVVQPSVGKLVTTDFYRGKRPNVLPKNRRDAWVRNRVVWSRDPAAAYLEAKNSPHRLGLIGNDQGSGLPCVGTVEQDLDTGWWRCLRCGLVARSQYVDHFSIRTQSSVRPDSILQAAC